jgi:hypothetical protein
VNDELSENKRDCAIKRDCLFSNIKDSSNQKQSTGNKHEMRNGEAESENSNPKIQVEERAILGKKIKKIKVPTHLFLPSFVS